MAENGFVFLLIFALAFGAPLVLYWLLSRETQDLPQMDREEAERRAQAEGKQYNRRTSDNRDGD